MSTESVPPAAVRRASWLLAAGALLSAALMIAAHIALAQLRAQTPIVLRVFANGGIGSPPPIDDIRGDLQVPFAAGLFGVVALALGALLVRRPIRLVRTAMLASAIVLTALVALEITGSPETLLVDANKPPEVNAAVAKLLPAWYPNANSVIAAALLAVTVAAVVMLLREESGDFFRLHHQGGGPSLSAYAVAIAQRRSDAETAGYGDPGVELPNSATGDAAAPDAGGRGEPDAGGGARLRRRPEPG